MVFHRSLIKTSDINVVMQQNTIERVKSTKFLGLIVTASLSEQSFYSIFICSFRLIFREVM